jgi:hypothetical protein
MGVIGGKRKGAGRKPARGERKETLALRVTPTLRAFLDDQSESMSDVVEDTIRRTKAFRDWEKVRK